MNDFRFALRQLAKSPVFTSVAVVSLALGIGANTAIFSLVNAILLSSLPVPNPQELRTIQWSGADSKIRNYSGSIDNSGMRNGAGQTASRPRQRADSFSFPVFRTLREQGAAAADIFGFSELSGVNVRARQEPFSAEGLIVTDNFFSGLGVRPVIGRLFTAGDDHAGTAPIVVITYGWWEREFALDPGALGQTVELNNNAFTVVGVLPRDFHGVGIADAKEFYVPMSAQPLLMPSRPLTSPDNWWFHAMARVRPGVNTAQLQPALEAIFIPQAAGFMAAPKLEIGDGRAGPAYDQRYYRRPLLLLLGVVGVVILVACANLAGLSLARSAARQHEFAVRAALGSGRWRLIRQSLTESFLLAAAGGALGVVLAIWGTVAVSRLLAGSPDGLRYDTSLDLTVLAFTFALTLVTALLSGFLPAWRAGQVDPVEGLKSRGALGTPRLQMGKILVTAQIALSVLLLAGAGLYVRTIVNLVRVNPGFATENLLLFQLNPRTVGLRGATAAQFFERVQDSLAKVPGVRAVALTQMKLLAGMMSGGSFYTLPSHPEFFTGDKKPAAYRLTVSESFFPTMGIPVVLGRGLTAADVDSAPKVVVVNESFARKNFANEIPIGQTLKVGNDEWTIVGVCRDAKYSDIKADAPPTVYFSNRQSGVGSGYLAVRTVLPPLAIVTAARRAVAAVNPNVPLADITTQEAVRDSRISQERMFATLVSALAALAVLLSCIGLYGLMAYNVTRRTGEIGVRMALGAQPRNIAAGIVAEALWLAGIGIAVGVPVALGLAQLIRGQLFGVPAHDPVTFAAGGAFLLLVALAAALIPARRATRVDPLVALRAE
jgi:predicted permease